jgi:hypothetical protein
MNESRRCDIDKAVDMIMEELIPRIQKKIYTNTNMKVLSSGVCVLIVIDSLLIHQYTKSNPTTYKNNYQFNKKINKKKLFLRDNNSKTFKS